MRGKLLRGETRASQPRTLMTPPLTYAASFSYTCPHPWQSSCHRATYPGPEGAVWCVPVHGGRDEIVSCSLEVNPPCGGGVPACTPAAPLMCAN